MGAITTAIVAAEEGAAGGLSVSPFVFGATAFVALAVLLVVTMMIKVDR